MGPLDLDRESVDEGDEVDEERYGPVGAELEKRDAPPRYTRPARELPALLQDTDLLVRTDFGDDTAWAALVEPVRRPPHSDVIDDFGPYLRFVDDPAFAGAPLSSSRSCKRAAGLRARYDCCPLLNG
ncbi:DUF6924 domain-containing protein [Streptomyces griseoaurantiacus]|uniref:DUF6924 domain-containing protein n=1 Tax=Streptomyces griseoaurantiacus TaxID=68213 RepID=UPI00367C1EE7